MITDYNTWMKEVNKHLVRICGFTSDDLPDALWADYHDSELSPLEAIDSAIWDAWDDQDGMVELYDAYIDRFGVAV
jgi:hypothetical protein